MKRLVWLVLAVITLSGAPAVGAEGGAPTDLDPASLHEEVAQLESEIGPPGPIPGESDVERITLHIAKGLRCPVCQGSSLAESPVEGANAMRARIRELVAVGFTEDQIRDYFSAPERYGEWVLLEPRATGLNALLWIAPGLLAGVAVAWAAMIAIRWRREPDEVPLPSDVGLAPKDKYEERLLREMDE